MSCPFRRIRMVFPYLGRCAFLILVALLSAFKRSSLILTVRPNNIAALFVIMTVIGVCSIPMLAVGMELACELTRVADGSSAIVWFT